MGGTTRILRGVVVKFRLRGRRLTILNGGLGRRKTLVFMRRLEVVGSLTLGMERLLGL